MHGYPGTDVVTIIPSPLTSGYGLWPTTQVADGGDKRNAANLMAAAENLADRVNFLGWRVCYLNPIEGVTQAEAIWTSPINTQNSWIYRGSVYVQGVSMFLRANQMQIDQGKILDVGDPAGLSGAGALFVRANGSFGVVDGGVASFANQPQFTKNLAASTAPLTNSLVGTNTPKAWGSISISGTGVPSVDDGFNVNGVARSGNEIIVSFANSMANANHAVVMTTVDGTFFRPVVTGRTASGFRFSLLTEDPTAVQTISGTWAQTYSCSFVVMGRQ